MKRITGLLLLVFALLAVPMLQAETVNGILMDKLCSSKVAPKGFDAAKAHTKACALMPNCAASGYVVVTEAGKVLKFDAAGDEKAAAALKATSKSDNLMVTVEGTVSGDNITVQSLKII